MGLAKYTYNRSTSGGEIITHLINSTDGAGLHFDGITGNVEIAAGGTVPDLGTKFSMEFIVQADADFAGTNTYLVDFGTGGRFALGNITEASGFSIRDNTSYGSFGVGIWDDLKVHHIVVTVDGTSAIAYDNGNEVGTTDLVATPTLDLCSAAFIGANYLGSGSFFNGTIFRARLWNKTLSSTDITELYENAALNFADQWGSETDLTSGSFAGFGSFGTGVTESGGVITGTGAATGNIANKAISLVPNGVYRIDFEILTITSGSLNLNPAGSGGETPARSAVGVYNETLTVPSDSSGSLNLKSGTAFAGTVGNISVRRTGCVADYDLAMANPAISTTVQNRNDTISADGTASSTGVTQITKIEQVNVKALAVGADAGAVADGGITATGLVTIESTYPRLNFTDTNNDSDYSIINADGVFSIYDVTNASNRLTIDSAGDVTMTGDLDVTAPDTVVGKISIQGGNDEVLAVGEVNARLDFRSNDGSVSNGVAGSITSVTESANGSKVGLGISTYDQTGGHLREVVRIASSGIATFSAGIAFSSQTDTTTGTTTATTLDHYEEGSFTPTITGDPLTPGTHSSILRRGDYVRVGNICTVSGYYYGTSGTGSGDMILGGLPFNVSGSTVAVGNIQANAGVIFTAGTLPAWIGAGGATFKVRQTFLTGAAFQYAAYPTDPAYLRWTITYITA